MKKLLVLSLMCLSFCTNLSAQGMSDTQLKQFIQKEIKAGSSQSQIVTKLVQRGVTVDQIRRVREQVNKQIQTTGHSATADAAITEMDARMRQNNDGRTGQDIMSAKKGTATEVYNEADVEYAEIQQSINTKEVNAVEQIDDKKVFGRDIFNNELLSFNPNMNIATPQSYVLGPGDMVFIDIYGASQKTEQLTVSPEGSVTVPGYGPIAVSGLSVTAAQNKIRSSLGSRYSSSSIKLSVGQTRSIMVNVMGEVKVPGTYTLSAFSTVFHALYMAGGINDLGTLRNVKVFRNNRLVTVVDVYDYILNGRLTGNIPLTDNDVIVVGPYDCLVGITGNVKRPMFYEMRPTESVGTLLNYAGGFAGDAYKKAVRLVRKTGEKHSVYTIEEFDLNTFKVDDGDVVSVDEILNRYENMVEVKGAVFRPGQYQFGNDITTVRSLIEKAAGVTEDAFTTHAVMHRMKADRTLEVISVDVAGIMAGTVADIPLSNEDVLFIPTQADRISERILTIEGEVISPGIYQFADNQTLEDLILQAGGLTDAASVVKVDVSRRIVDPKATTSGKEIAKTYSFALKDGFVIDGEQGFYLEPYDVVYVRKSPGYYVPRNITISGEVLFEGQYTMNTKNLRLSDAINMANGVTEEAYVKGARLERKLTEDERARRQALLDKIKSTGSDEKDTIDVAKLDLSDTYTVGIYLDKALENPGSDYDIVLREGDHLIVPEYNGTVKISGDVMFPNTVAFNAKKGYKWYVNQAGGFGNRAKKSKTWIIYQNGTMAKVGSGIKVEPGCEIIVPSKQKRDAASLTRWLSIGTSVTSMAAMVATLVNVLK